MTATSWAARGLVTALAQPRPLTADNLRAVLTELGTTAEEVARTLFAAGHVGDRGCGGTCPVAHYLTTFWPAVQDLQVGSMFVAAGGRGTPVVTAAVPEPVGDFIVAFDEGKFHALDAAAVTG